MITNFPKEIFAVTCTNNKITRSQITANKADASTLKKKNNMRRLSGFIKEDVFLNEPLTGFKFGDTFSEGCILIEDPRGFTIPVEASFLAYSLSNMTVINGVIQDECVWANRGVSYFLLSKTSEEYISTTTAVSEAITFNNLIPGDIVTPLTNQGEEFIFIGMGSESYSARMNLGNQAVTFTGTTTETPFFLPIRYGFNVNYSNMRSKSCKWLKLDKKISTNMMDEINKYKNNFMPVNLTRYWNASNKVSSAIKSLKDDYLNSLLAKGVPQKDIDKMKWNSNLEIAITSIDWDLVKKLKMITKRPKKVK